MLELFPGTLAHYSHSLQPYRVPFQLNTLVSVVLQCHKRLRHTEESPVVRDKLQPACLIISVWPFFHLASSV